MLRCHRKKAVPMKPNKIFRSTLLSALVVMLLCGASLCAQQVRANWSRSAAFSSYKTYQWIPSEATNHPFYRQFVNEYANYGLTHKKQLQRVSASGNPDLLVTYHFTTQEVMDTETCGYGFGPGWGWGWADGEVPTSIALEPCLALWDI